MKEKKIYTHECKNCGNEFQTLRSDSANCSTRCRIERMSKQKQSYYSKQLDKDRQAKYYQKNKDRIKLKNATGIIEVKTEFKHIKFR